MKLVIISIALASPVGYYLMNEWLGEFAYRIDMKWWMFASAGAGTILMALITVSFQAIKAALMNPVESLKSE